MDRKYNVNNLSPFKSKWNNLPTKLVRIPVKLENQILSFSHDLDNGNNCTNSLVTEKIKQLINKVDNKEKGYRSNSATQLIKDLRALL